MDARSWMTVEQTGAALGVSRATVWRLIQRRELASLRHGGRRWIARSAVRSRTQVAAQTAPAFTLDNPLFKLMGAFQSDGRGPGSSDKYSVLFD